MNDCEPAPSFRRSHLATPRADDVILPSPIKKLARNERLVPGEFFRTLNVLQGSVSSPTFTNERVAMLRDGP